MKPRNRYDATTISDLIELFGGPSKLAAMLELNDSAICNWSARGFIPPSWHMRLYVELLRIGKTADPELLFEMSPDQARVLFRAQAAEAHA